MELNEALQARRREHGRTQVKRSKEGLRNIVVEGSIVMRL
jgi:hypothetical protein